MNTRIYTSEQLLYIILHAVSPPPPKRFYFACDDEASEREKVAVCANLANGRKISEDFLMREMRAGERQIVAISIISSNPTHTHTQLHRAQSIESREFQNHKFVFFIRRISLLSNRHTRKEHSQRREYNKFISLPCFYLLCIDARVQMRKRKWKIFLLSHSRCDYDIGKKEKNVLNKYLKITKAKLFS